MRPYYSSYRTYKTLLVSSLSLSCSLPFDSSLLWGFYSRYRVLIEKGGGWHKTMMGRVLNGVRIGGAPMLQTKRKDQSF